MGIAEKRKKNCFQQIIQISDGKAEGIHVCPLRLFTALFPMLTKRLLKEGLLRMPEKQTLSRISLSELCGKSGINRVTSYKHYESRAELVAILKRVIGENLLF